MTRIFLSDSELKTEPIRITDDKARYLTTVLRCRAGDPLSITDSSGNSFSARILAVTKQEVSAEILGIETPPPESPVRIKLLQGLLKGEKMDFVVQKATELGVAEIVPVITERSQVRETRKLQRWRKIAEEAARQSGRSVVPPVSETKHFDDLFTGHLTDGGILFWEAGGSALKQIIQGFSDRKSLTLFTGPEGGFSPGEVEAAKQAGFLVATMGRRILRAETAAIGAIAVVQYALGDLG